jgi:hypothetical protein
MNAQDLLDLLFAASNARTKEEQARIAWRASDFMWQQFPNKYDAKLCREFNNLVSSKDFPWVKDLWSEEERKDLIRELYAKS